MTIIDSENLVAQPWGRSGSLLLLEDELHTLRPLDLVLVSALVVSCWCFRGINLSVSYQMGVSMATKIPNITYWGLLKTVVVAGMDNVTGAKGASM